MVWMLVSVPDQLGHLAKAYAYYQNIVDGEDNWLEEKFKIKLANAINDQNNLNWLLIAGS